MKRLFFVLIFVVGCTNEMSMCETFDSCSFMSVQTCEIMLDESDSLECDHSIEVLDNCIFENGCNYLDGACEIEAEQMEDACKISDAPKVVRK